MKNNVVANYLSGVWQELHKVKWPTKFEIINHTVIVLISAVVATAILAALDFSLTKLIEYIVENRS